MLDCVTLTVAVKGAISLAQVLAWPIVVILAIVLFKKELADILPNVEEVGTGGVKIGRGAAKRQANEQQVVTANPAITATPTANAPPVSPVIVAFERSIVASLETMLDGAKIPALTRALASVRVELAFERVYRLIFGSQIAALKRLLENGPSNRTEAEGYFDEIKRRYPEFYRDGNFEEWVGFLLRQELVNVDRGTYRITEAGIEFLTYLFNLRLPEQKPF